MAEEYEMIAKHIAETEAELHVALSNAKTWAQKARELEAVLSHLRAWHSSVAGSTPAKRRFPTKMIITNVRSEVISRSMMGTVKEAALSMRFFTPADLEAKVREQNPDANYQTIISALRRLKNQGIVEETLKGHYSPVKHDEETADE